jgi:aminoglycoside phosphotransferase (APT) family kinase protein
LQYEIKALNSGAVKEACRKEPSVKVPRVLRTVKNGFIMNWVGESDLRTAFKTGRVQDPAAAGRRLGRWLGCLHLAGIELGSDGWSSTHDELDKFYVPGGLAEGAIRASMDDDEAERVLIALRAPVTTRTLTPWDFRPMNVVVRLSDDIEALPGLTVVDWELCHYGDPSDDIRMWVAEVTILEAKFGDRGLLSSFLSAYKQEVGTDIVNDGFVSRVALSVGLYILWMLPLNPALWDCTEEDVSLWKCKSLEFIRAGTSGDMAWIKHSCLAPLLDV